MKTLIIVRHAKSSWGNSGLDDFDRPLNERGKKDAPEMAKRLKKTGILPDLWLSSPAKRAISTARKFAKEFNTDPKQIEKVKKLYHAYEFQIQEIVQAIPKKTNVAILFGHNPGLTFFVNEISNLRTDNIPTCGVVILEISSWDKIGKEDAKLVHFDYPKNTVNK